MIYYTEIRYFSSLCIYLSHHKMILFFQKAFQKTNTSTCLSSPPSTNSLLPEKILMYRRAAVALNCYFLAKNNYCKFLGNLSKYVCTNWHIFVTSRIFKNLGFCLDWKKGKHRLQQWYEQQFFCNTKYLSFS